MAEFDTGAECAENSADTSASVENLAITNAENAPDSTEQTPPPVDDSIEGLEPDFALKLALELGLTEPELEHIKRIQDRYPTITELYIYSLMWSEHCSYKHSKKQLRKFNSKSERVLQGPGENAGVVSLGDGWAVAFKMESHNHPSAIEPFEGAATGVGGIIRDIFTMGARPIACLDSLRFGSLDKPRQRYLFDGAVAGISAYGNCLGVPTVGGEIYFDPAYEGNCLIDVMGVGLMREENLTRAVGSGPGNHVVLIGSSTGRDGIGGASVLASQEFDEAAENKRPAVQVGDPLQEKLLIEVCLDLLGSGLFVALGDLGAAGLTSSASEMASRGGVGIDIDVSKVHRRETGMQPFEVMVSESQERMLAVVTPENLAEVKSTCDKWEITCSVIGSITDTGRFVVRDSAEGNAIVADMPAEKLAEDAPEYDPAMVRPAYLDEVQSFDPNSLDLPLSGEELKAAFANLLASPNISSRSWIWNQYDHQVQNNTAILPGSDAAVLRVSATGRGLESNKGLAISTDCNGMYCYLDPKGGAMIALVEAARNVSCSGALPLAITDCLNFGNPEKPEVFYTFSECVDGLVEACAAFEIPVISGNVSFYNESFGNAIYPTPTIGLVGLIEDIEYKMDSGFKNEDDVIILLGDTRDELGGSELLRWCFDKVAGQPPKVDLNHEVALCATLRELISSKLIKSAHDCSEGGLALCLAESAILGGLGFDVNLECTKISPAATLFSESQGRVVVSANEESVEAILKLCAKSKINAKLIGKVKGEKFVFNNMFEFDLTDASKIWGNTLERMVNGLF